ncbi:MAG: sulfite exporter TauE/SafE family protein [Pseudomonadota bacterium]
MDIATLGLLASAVFAAALLQSATGIGYGVIAGPILLVALNGIEAFQISALHTLVISAVLLPALFHQVERRLLLLFVLGSAIGLPLGFALQMQAEVFWLKLVALAMVAFVATTLLRDLLRPRGADTLRAPHHSPVEAGGVGAASGLLGGMVSMPGPVPATWMAISGYTKRDVRATILAYFVFVFGALTAFYAATTGFAPTTLRIAALLGLPLVAGIWAGHALSRLISERLFRRVLFAILCATILLLVSDLLRSALSKGEVSVSYLIP